MKSEPGFETQLQAAEESSSTPSNEFDESMDYAEDLPVHPLAPAPLAATTTPTTAAHSNNSNSSYMSSTVQPQQHQQLLKLKTEHGVPSLPPPIVSPPDIIMSNNNETEGLSASSSAGPSRRTSHDSNMGSSEAVVGHDAHFQHSQNPLMPSSHEKSHLVVDTSSTQAVRHHSLTPTSNTAPTPTSSMNTDTTMTTGLTAPSSRRGSLRTMTATLPRSALQEETIALFKQYRNLIPCAKCFCRNTIQRDGMSDGNLRFKCRPPVSMSLICNKSYSESKIRNMIAGVVYGHSLPDSATPNSASSTGDNVLALAPPPTTTTTKTSRRASTKVESSPRLGSDLGAVPPERLQRLQEDQEFRSHEQRDLSRENSIHPERESEGYLESRRQSHPHPYMLPQGGSSRRPSVQQLRRPSLVADDSMMMEYDDASSSPMPPHHHTGGGHLQVPGTPPLESEDPRYRSRSAFGGHTARSVTPTPHHPHASHQASPSNRQGGQKLHHSHSHPNIGQARHQQFLEQQEREREHRGVGNSGMGYPSQQQQQQQRPLQRQIVRRESTQYLGSAAEQRRSSQPSPILGGSHGSKYHTNSNNEALSPALSSSAASPRPSPGREMMIHHDQQQPNTPSSLRGRYDESTNTTGYFQRRMSQPQTGGGHNNAYSGHAGLPPPLPSPLSHPYDRRASEADEYTQMHREKYEKLNASTLLAPGSATASAQRNPHGHQQQSQQKQLRPHHPVLPPPGSPNGHGGGQHPLDVTDQGEDASRQALTPPMRSSNLHSGGQGPSPSAPWMNGGHDRQGTPPHQGLPTPQAEPMRYSHSLPMGGGSQRPSLRQHQSSSNLYYQTPRPDDRNTFEDNDRDVSPEYHSVDADGRPVARMRQQGLKRKSLGQAMRRSSSSQSLYSTSLQQGMHQHHNHHQPQHQQRPSPYDSYHNNSNNIKLTCFPNGQSKNSLHHPSTLATSQTLETSQALAMQLSQSSKIVIEIRQPRSLQSYSSATNLREHMKRNNNAFDDDDRGHRHQHLHINGGGRSLHRATSTPNLMLARSSSSVLGHRRSASPDQMDFGTSKKRRADTDSVAVAIEGVQVGDNKMEDSNNNNKATDSEGSSPTVVLPGSETSNAQTPGTTATMGSAIQVFGMEYLAKAESDPSVKTGEGLGLLDLGLASATSPDIEALGVAKASSYVVLEDQKEMGIDYSQFTRVETAGWRILIPPNVVASFRSEDFGLMLKPKGLEESEELEGQDSGHEEKGDDEMEREEESKEVGHHKPLEEDDEDVNVEGVSRIALRDDDKEDMVVATSASKAVNVTNSASKICNTQQKVTDEGDLDMQMERDQKFSRDRVPTDPERVKTFETIAMEEQGDIEMDREQDELVEDDD
ncbi:hypothetical protein BGX28_004880 [Mortierella sp. GBA30]|nr:hypothetical protein BGX28_004880 [Mortierella sp. GBA30]